jgi:hypothetical protein
MRANEPTSLGGGAGWLNPEQEDHMELVKLTSGGKEVFVNPNLIRLASPLTSAGTRLSFDKDHGVNVAESPTEVAEAIRRLEK